MSLLATLLELGDATSKKLGYSYDRSPAISFGEETITETNLLELQYRHPNLVKIEMFSKWQESRTTGADWEWHLIGKHWTLKFRVQAKRITKAGKIKGLHQQSKHATRPQIDMLIEDAKNTDTIPIYCFYSAERHRSYWTSGACQPSGATPYETGCLLAPASLVKSLDPKNLSSIENNAVPWHYLWSQQAFSRQKTPYEQRYLKKIPEQLFMESIELTADPRASSNFLPCHMHQLNSEKYDPPKITGLSRTKDDGFVSSSAKEHGVFAVVSIDVSKPSIFEHISR